MRDPAKLAVDDPKLSVVTGDVLDSHSIDAPMIAQQAVVISLGMKPSLRDRKPVTLFSDGTDNILRAMMRHNVRRLICITGAGAENESWFGRILEPFLLRGIYEDKNRQEEMIRASDRDWVIVRPARLTDQPAMGQYAALPDARAAKPNWISRADVANFVIDQVKSNRYLYRAALLTE